MLLFKEALEERRLIPVRLKPEHIEKAEYPCLYQNMQLPRHAAYSFSSYVNHLVEKCAMGGFQNPRGHHKASILTLSYLSLAFFVAVSNSIATTGHVFSLCPKI